MVAGEAGCGAGGEEGVMVYIVLTAEAFEEIARSGVRPDEIWLNGGIVDSGRISRLRSEGWRISTWTKPFDPESDDEREAALSTVREHHPEATIWLEVVNRANGYG